MNLKLLWYCTKSDLKLYKTIDNDYTVKKAKDNIFGYEELNGKIVAESDFEMEEIRVVTQYTIDKSWDIYLTPNLEPGELKKRSRLNDSMLDKYKPNYAIHIENLYKFIKPKELKEKYEKVIDKMVTERNRNGDCTFLEAQEKIYKIYNDNEALIDEHDEVFRLMEEVYIEENR